jgi:GGDEF domain-containing protein
LPSLHNAIAHEASLLAARGQGTARDALLLLALDPHPLLERVPAMDLLGDLADYLRDVLREPASVFHIDPETLAVLLPGAAGAAAPDTAERVRMLIATAHLRGGVWQGVKAAADGPPGDGGPLTVSIGITRPRGGDSSKAVLARARQALDRARDAGGNQIVEAE